MEKQKKKTLIFLIVTILVALAIFLYNLGKQYMWTDEIFSFHAAEMIIEKGKALYDSGLYYARSNIYHNLLAVSMQLFGGNELGSRIINIPFAIGTILLCFFFVKDLFKKKDKSFYIAAIASILYLFCSFTIACVRETRMYMMEVFFFTLTAFAYYKAFLAKNGTKLLHIKNLTFRYNIVWILVAGISFLIAYETQPLAILWGVGLLLFYILQFILKRRKEDFAFILLIILGGLGAMYIRYQSFNIFQIFAEISPYTTETGPKLLYYPILLVRNFPGIAIVSPFIIWSLIKFRKKIDVYMISIIIAYLGIITFQQAQHERYLQPIVPLIFVFSILCLARLSIFLKNKFSYKYAKYLSLGVLVIFFVPQLYVFQKEYREIDTYTKSSLSIHKKMEFNKLFNYLDTTVQDLDERILVADYHSAFTLIQKGYDVDYILITQTRQSQEKDTKDIYFNVPYLVYTDSSLSTFLAGKKYLVVVRDYDSFIGIENQIQRVNSFVKPQVFINE